MSRIDRSRISPAHALIVLGLLLGAPGLASGLPRAPFRTFDTAYGPHDACVADFDRDGRPDVATSNYYDFGVSVLLGAGDGTLRNHTDFRPGFYHSEAIVCGDLNGDSNPDIVFTGSSGFAEILLGRGDGTFADAQHVEIGSIPSALEMADVNRDGRPDLLVTNQFYDAVSIYLGRGDGTFQPRVTAAVNGPRALAAGDFNGDGLPDLAVVSDNNGRVSILPGRGDGSFGPPASFAAGFGLNSIALADLNGDGRLDVGCAGDSGISVLPGNGDGTLQPWTSFPAGSTPTAIAWGDVNGDGRPDAMAVSYYSSREEILSVLLGNGDGTLGTRMVFPTGLKPSSVAGVDLNGDGHLDLVVTDSNADDLSVLLGNGDGSFGYQNNTAVESGPTFAVLGNFDGDGNLDVAVANRFSASVSLLAGHGDGSLAAAVSVPAARGVYSLAMGDLNRDGWPDLVTGYEYASGGISISVLLGTGAMGFADHVDYATSGYAVTSVAIGDLNGDGVPDVVCGENVVAVLLGNGDGTLQQAVIYSGVSAADQVVLADVDEDHHLDLLVRSAYGIGLMRGNGDGTLGPSTTIDFLSGSYPIGLAVADLDEDGHLDIIVGSGGVGVLRGHGDGTFESVQTHVTNKAPNAIATADLDGDGHVDVIAANGDWNSLTILRGRGDATFDSKIDLGTGGRPYYSVAVGDLNHDARPDLIVPGHFSNSVRVLLNEGVATNRPPIARAGTDVTRECEGNGQASAMLDGAASSDPDSSPGTNDDIVSFEWFADFASASPVLLGSGVRLPVTLTLGAHRITLKVQDKAGATSTADVMVTVVDTTPPSLTLTLSPTTLWPPNHRMVLVHAVWQVSDVCDPSVGAALVSATSSEPDDAPGGGDGNTKEDIQDASIGTPDTMVLLRAERSADGPGRIYTLTCVARDESGNTASALGIVTVPHDEGTGPEPVRVNLEMAHLYWNAVSGAEMYDLIQGDLNRVSVSNGVTWLGRVHVLASGQSGTSYTEGANGAMPSVGMAFFYLVQYRQGQSASGWGTESSPWPAEPSSCDLGCPGAPVASSLASVTAKRR